MRGFLLLVLLVAAGVALYVYLKGRSGREVERTAYRERLTQGNAPGQRTTTPAPREPSRATVATFPLPEGRKLRTTLDRQTALATLEKAVSAYRQQPYPAMPYLSFPRFAWRGTDGPDLLVAFEGETSPRYVAFWGSNTVSQIGMFDADGELTLPEIGRWVMAGGSLTSIGTIPSGSLSLGAPRVVSGYQQDILAGAGVPVTEQSLRLLDAKIREMFLIKAWQFLTLEGKQNQAEAEQFSQRWSGAAPQEILDALSSSKPEVLPYLWDLPERVRGILLADPSSWIDDVTESSASPG